MHRLRPAHRHEPRALSRVPPEGTGTRPRPRRSLRVRPTALPRALRAVLGAEGIGGAEVSDYTDFLASKARIVAPMGRKVRDLSPVLWDYQRILVEWACRLGRAAIFADCGLGKTLMQLEWARQMTTHRCLIVAPLCVVEQTRQEARLLGMDVERVSEPSAALYQITNYERLKHFVGAQYDAIVLDESSILKSLAGKTRTMLLEEFTHIPYRLCCTATPAPNDVAELANHVQFLGVMSRPEMLSTYFIHGDGSDWRLKRHAVGAFWRFCATWARFLRGPRDIGVPRDMPLPALDIATSVVEVDQRASDSLFIDAAGIAGRREARKRSLTDRVERIAEMVAGRSDQCVVWCELNAEGNALAEALGDKCLHIEGATDDDTRVEHEARWRRGDVQCLVVKPGMFGFGVNWQHCHWMIYCGIGDSYERYYQTVRRLWRIGQTHPVQVDVVVSQAEQSAWDNVRRKAAEAAQLTDGVVAVMSEYQTEKAPAAPYEARSVKGDAWEIVLGDSCEELSRVADDSVGLSVFSPPFSTLYTYSATDRDLGNTQNDAQFFDHMRFVIDHLMRVTMPARRACVHVQQLSTTLAMHGEIGLRDFRGEMIRAFQARGWVYDGEVCIDKDPQAQAIRTKAKALMFVQKNKDSTWSRPALADYILLFRKPGQSDEPVRTDVTNEEWIEFARPIWYGIRESDTLQYTAARAPEDERHICPLQLDTIRRCIRLWSNPGDLVLSPFAGIGSEGHVALELGRRFFGVELKPEYHKIAVRNLEAAGKQLGLFGALG